MSIFRKTTYLAGRQEVHQHRFRYGSIQYNKLVGQGTMGFDLQWRSTLCSDSQLRYIGMEYIHRGMFAIGQQPSVIELLRPMDSSKATYAHMAHEGGIGFQTARILELKLSDFSMRPWIQHDGRRCSSANLAKVQVPSLDAPGRRRIHGGGGEQEDWRGAVEDRSTTRSSIVRKKS